MPNYVRPRSAGATIFFTVCLATRGSDILTREIDHLRWAVRRTRDERPFAILAWVVLPDHMHCIWRLPPGDGDFATRWRLIKTRFSSRFLPAPGRTPSQRRRAEKGLWQRRYWEHHIRGEEDFTLHLRYCWLNPVKHGLVSDPWDWPYSSIHRHWPLDVQGACEHAPYSSVSR